MFFLLVTLSVSISVECLPTLLMGLTSNQAVVHIQPLHTILVKEKGSCFDLLSTVVSLSLRYNEVFPLSIRTDGMGYLLVIA